MAGRALGPAVPRRANFPEEDIPAWTRSESHSPEPEALPGRTSTGNPRAAGRGIRRFVLNGLCDNHAGRRAAFAATVTEQFGVEPRLFGSRGDGRQRSVDAADICTPHAFHHTTPSRAWRAGWT